LKKKTPREISLNLLNRIGEAGLHPDRLLSDSFKRFRHLDALDRAFLTELTYGVLRRKGKLDWIIGQFSKTPIKKIEPEILNLLRLGLYQILFLSKTPVSAAVNESVELAKRFRSSGGAGFVNGILRSILRKKGEIFFPELEKDPVSHISVVQSYPAWLVARWIGEMGIEETLRVCEWGNRKSSLTLRTNTLKSTRENLMEKLKESGLKPFPAPYSPEGIRIEDPPPTSELPFLKEGLYIIQDEASQLVTALFDPMPGERILDACAGPGGKTTHIGQRMKNEGEVFALDNSKEKVEQIKEIAARLGINIVKAMKGDSEKSLPIPEGMEFDRVLADVPCSGFGTLRKNPDLKWGRGEDDIHRLAALQSSILANLSRYVKRGGVLVYSTCTVFHEENEDVIEKFLKEHPEFRLDSLADLLPEPCRSLTKGDYFKTFPFQDEMDGFFAARLIKT